MNNENKNELSQLEIEALKKDILTVTSENEKLKKILDQNSKVLSIFSHDIRSPLATITYLGLMVLDEYDKIANQFPELKQTEAYNFLNSIIEYSRISADTLNSYGNWVKRNKDEFNLNNNEYNINKIIDEVYPDFKIRAEAKNINLIHNNNHDDLTVYTDKDIVHIILNNLISNSIKFTEGGKNIYVSAEPLDELYVKATVRDEGKGIPDDIKKKLFLVEGITTEGTNNEKGTGKGLIFCRELVEKQGGKIWIDEQNDYNGTKIHFTIPKYSSNEMVIKSEAIKHNQKYY